MDHLVEENSTIMFCSFCTKNQILQSTHIDHKPITHIPFDHTIICFVNFLNRDELNIRDDIMLCTKVQHFLGFCGAANHRTHDSASVL